MLAKSPKIGLTRILGNRSQVSGVRFQGNAVTIKMCID